MLGDIMITRAQLGTEKIDLHSHAKFNCRMSKLIRRIKNLFA